MEETVTTICFSLYAACACNGITINIYLDWE